MRKQPTTLGYALMLTLLAACVTAGGRTRACRKSMLGRCMREGVAVCEGQLSSLLAGDCNSPTVIPAEGGTFSGVTSGPSQQAGSCATSSGLSPEHVFQWNPAVSGTATIQTCGAGTSLDTVLYMRSGSCAGGAEVAAGCNDDACTNASGLNLASRITPTVTAGQTYFIVVDAFGGQTGTFSLTVTPPAAPATTTATTRLPTTTTTTTLPGGGACASPTVIPAQGGTFGGTTSGTSSLAGSCGSSGTSPERVFQWTPAVSGTATIQTCGAATSFDTVLYLRGGACASGPEVAAGCNDDACADASGLNRASRLTPTVTAGQTYFIVVDGYGGTHGSFSLTITPPAPTTTTTTLPGGGGCSSPIAIPASGGRVSGATSGTSALAGSCGSSGTAPERVYQWTPAVSGTATIQTCGAGTTFDTVLYLRS